MIIGFGVPKQAAVDSTPDGIRKGRYGVAPRIVLIMGLSIVIGFFIPDIHPGMIAFGKKVQNWSEPDEYMHTSVGRTASVAVSRVKEGYRFLHISGKTVASTWPLDMRLQRILGHLPSMFHPDPKSVLIIGFGAGVTAGSFTLYPGIERIVIVEIEPEVPAASGVYFKKENYDVLNDPRTEIIYDDARHYIATTKETFDVITADPIHPWVKGAAALYSKEFFELTKAHLNPGGFITQWVPLYETNEEAVKSQVGTFLDVFSNGSIWNTSIGREGYDLALLGHVEPLVIDTDVLQKKLNMMNDKVRQSLADVKMLNPASWLMSYAGRRPDVSEWLENYQPNLDRNLKLEYLAGEGMDIRQDNKIYNAMIARLSYPDDFFRIDADNKRKYKAWFTKTYPTK